MEEKFEVETPFGPIWFWGHDTGLPVVLLITGTFAEFDTLDGLAEVLVGVDTWRVHLPGNHCPSLVAVSIGVFVAAFNHAIEARLSGRPLVVVGLSVGAVVAMGLQASGLRRLVLVEPVLLTEGLWPLRVLAERLPPGGEAFAWNILGIAPGRQESRDYTPLLAGLTTPAYALIGDVPLEPPRNTLGMTSLVTPAARRALEAHPRIQVGDAPGAGHNVPRDSTHAFLTAIVQSCQAVFGPDVRYRRPPPRKPPA